MTVMNRAAVLLLRRRPPVAWGPRADTWNSGSLTTRASTATMVAVHSEGMPCYAYQTNEGVQGSAAPAKRPHQLELRALHV